MPAAAEYVLRSGADNPLIKAILLGAHGGDTDLLPLLATRLEPLLDRAIATLAGEARQRYPHLPLDERTLSRLAAIVVRLTLSHLLQPREPIDEAIAEIRTLIEATLQHAQTGAAATTLC